MVSLSIGSTHQTACVCFDMIHQECWQRLCDSPGPVRQSHFASHLQPPRPTRMLHLPQRSPPTGGKNNNEIKHEVSEKCRKKVQNKFTVSRDTRPASTARTIMQTGAFHASSIEGSSQCAVCGCAINTAFVWRCRVQTTQMQRLYSMHCPNSTRYTRQPSCSSNLELPSFPTLVTCRIQASQNSRARKLLEGIQQHALFSPRHSQLSLQLHPPSLILTLHLEHLSHPPTANSAHNGHVYNIEEKKCKNK